MKHARKLTSLLLALVMVFALAVTAFAQDETVADGAGSITISNAALILSPSLASGVALI